MTRSQDDKRQIAHSNTVRQILEAAQNTWRAVSQMESEDQLHPDGVFLDADGYGDKHIQKRAHTHLMSYHKLVASKQYWIHADEKWQAYIKDRHGKELTITVPEKDEIHVDQDGVSIGDIETVEEPVSLELLSDRWSFRYVDVVSELPNSYGTTEEMREKKRVWLPPRAIALLFEQLEAVRAEIQLGADIDAKGWRADKVLDPTDGLREPYSEQEDEEA